MNNGFSDSLVQGGCTSRVRAMSFFLLVVAVFGLVPFGYYKLMLGKYDTMTERGQFGDMFGALNAACSLIAVIALFITLREQRRQIRYMSHAQAMELVWEVLQNERVRESRRYVLDSVPSDYRLVVKQGKPAFCAHIPPKHFEEVCTSYDFIGIMVKDGILNQGTVISNWGRSIARCWEILESRLENRRSKTFDGLWRNFDFLAKAAGAIPQRLPTGEYGILHEIVGEDF